VHIAHFIFQMKVVMASALAGAFGLIDLERSEQSEWWTPSWGIQVLFTNSSDGYYVMASANLAEEL